MIGKTYNNENYGVIEIDTSNGIVSFSLKDIVGKTVNTAKIKIKN